MRNSVFGLRFSHLTKSSLVAVLLDRRVPPEDGAKLIVTANVDHVVNLTRVTQFRDAYNFAWLIVADGAPIYAYARLRGIPLIERITGADLFLDLVTQFDQRHRPFFVASTEEAAQRTLRKLEAAGSCTDHFAYVVPPFGFEEDEAYSDFLVPTNRQTQHDSPFHVRRIAEIRNLGLAEQDGRRRPVCSGGWRGPGVFRGNADARTAAVSSTWPRMVLASFLRTETPGATLLPRFVPVSRRHRE